VKRIRPRSESESKRVASEKQGERERARFFLWASDKITIIIYQRVEASEI